MVGELIEAYMGARAPVGHDDKLWDSSVKVRKVLFDIYPKNLKSLITSNLSCLQLQGMQKIKEEQTVKQMKKKLVRCWS